MHCGHELPEAAAYCPGCDRPTPKTLASRSASKTPGTKTLWLLVAAGCAVFAFVFTGILAAILIPNFLDALQKAKQKRTVVDLRSVNTALAAYISDHERLPEGRSYEEVVAQLVPEYMSAAPEADGWKRPYRYECWSVSTDSPPEATVPAEAGPSVCDTYRVASPGRDGVFEHESLADYGSEVFPRQDYDRDLVVGDGFAIQYPGPAGVSGSLRRRRLHRTP